MNTGKSDISNPISNIDSLLWNRKNFSQNDITTKSISGKSIFSEEIKDNKDKGGQEKSERMIDILANKIYPLEHKKIENLGRTAINDWIMENVVLKELNNKIITDYLYLNKSLDPWTFLLVVEAVKEYTHGVVQHSKGKKIQMLTKNDLTNISLCNKVMDKLTNIVIRRYLANFYNYLDPNNKIKVKPIKQNKVVFNHPLVEFCILELRKKGDKESSINNNLILVIKEHFDWICTNLKEFMNYDINSIIVNQITEDHLKSYKSYLIREVAEGVRTELTAKRHLQYVKRFYSMLFSNNKIAKDVSHNVSNIRAEEYIYRVLPSILELQRFYDILQTYSQDPLRERLAFLLMTYLGFRMSEVCNLKYKDINIDNKTVSLRGKGDIPAILPIPKIILDIIIQLDVKETGYVFSNDTKGYQRHLYQNYKLYTMIAGWKYKGGPHLLRHSYITNLTSFCSVRILRVLSRHKTSHGLSKYIHVSNDRLTQAIDKINY